jgi:hypothetical protein
MTLEQFSDDPGEEKPSKECALAALGGKTQGGDDECDHAEAKERTDDDANQKPEDQGNSLVQ